MLLRPKDHHESGRIRGLEAQYLLLSEEGMYGHRCALRCHLNMTGRSPTDVVEGLKAAGRSAHFSSFLYGNVGE